MSLYLPISTVDLIVALSLLSVERSVAFWTSLLPRLSSFPAVDCASMTSSLDLDVDDRSYYVIPLKNKRLGLIQSCLKKTRV